MSKQALRRQREELFRQQAGRCYWCGSDLVLPQYPPPRHCSPPRNEATIDHLDSRLSPERGQHRQELRHVVACRDCNGKRNRQEQAALPREELWRRARSWPGGISW